MTGFSNVGALPGQTALGNDDAFIIYMGPELFVCHYSCEVLIFYYFNTYAYTHIYIYTCIHTHIPILLSLFFIFFIIKLHYNYIDTQNIKILNICMHV